MLQNIHIPTIPLAVFKANLEYQKSLADLSTDGVRRCVDFGEICGQLAASQAETMWERLHALSTWPSSGIAPLEIGSRQIQKGVQGMTTLQAQALQDQKAMVDGLRGARMAWQQTFFDAVGNSEDAAEL